MPTKDGDYTVTQGKVVGLFAGLLMFHGLLVSLIHARLIFRLMTAPELSRDALSCSSDLKLRVHQSWYYGRYVTVSALNSGNYRAHTHQVIIIVMLAMTPRHEMHPASYVFGSAGIINQTGGWNDGIAFLFGLLSVQWTVGCSFVGNSSTF